MNHTPVLTKEVLELIQPERGGLFVDATLGLGGHSQAVIRRNKELDGRPIRIIGLDQDKDALELAKKVLGEQIQYIQDNFIEIKSLIKEPVEAIIMDIGVSSLQLDSPERGFSIRHNGPLDMRMDPERNTVTAATIVNTWPEIKLANLFYQYGEERLSRKIAKAIVETRKKSPFKETGPLAEFIARQYPHMNGQWKIHPATRVFQSLRIEVNSELENLEVGLKEALEILKSPGGVLAVVSFHSLEDRIVKNIFKEAAQDGGYHILTKKPIVASREEEIANPRSRSAKLRAIVRA